MTKDRIAEGRARLDALSPTTPEILDDLFDQLAPDFLNHIYEYSFGTLYNDRDDKLDPKIRQAAVLGALIVQNQQRLVSTHIEIARNLGFSHAELAEMFTQVAAYAGFAPGVTAMVLLKEDYDRVAAAKAGTDAAS